jgi:2-oxoglutarate/2-oxoacid ferredoxin oxidoreductase subunit beta
MAPLNEQKKYESLHAPTWCPGCGNFAIWTALKRALAALNIPAHKVLMVYGIGCSGNMSNTLSTYGWHALHGRSLPTAVGAKLANKDLTVIVVAGDGDGYGEGMGHFIHAARGNVDITYLVHNNGVYGLTTGQASPTASHGFKAKSTPDGVIDQNVNPIALALSAGAGFVGRGFAGELDHLTGLMKQAIQHHGFSLLDILQPCVTFNPTLSYTFYRDRVYTLQDDTTFSTADPHLAMTRALDKQKYPIGVFYEDTKRPSYLDELAYLRGRALVARPAEKRSVRKHYIDFM